MKQAIEDITQRLQQRLPDQHAYFTPSELSEAGFPDFMVQRLRLGLSQRLERSIAPPRVEWADAGVGDVEVAWRQFSAALHANVRLPRKHAAKLLNEAVTDVLYLLSEPREFLPRYLFGNDSSLSLSQVRDRIPWIVVYPQLGQFLPKYMRARELKEISRARYENALRQLDDKLVQAYQPADWLTLLNSMFVLFEGQIPTPIVKRFFEDKARYGLAERIGGHHEEFISRGLLLGFLSPVRPEITEFETEKQSPAASKPVLKNPDKDVENGKDHIGTSDNSEEDRKSSDSDSEAVTEPEAALSKAEPDDHSLETEVSETPTADLNEQNAQTQDKEKNAATEPEPPVLPIQPETQESKAESVKAEASDGKTDSGTASEKDLKASENDKQAGSENKSTDFGRRPLYARFSEGQPAQKKAGKEEQRQASKQKLPNFKPPQKSGNDGTKSGTGQSVPLWKRLSEQSQKNAASTDCSDEPANRITGGKSPSKLPADLNSSLKKETDTNRETGKLRAFLADAEQNYVTELFKEDDAAFAQAIEALAGFNNWREAGKYLTNSIFRKSGINMYSNTAIEFTDRLHSYFKNHRGPE